MALTSSGGYGSTQHAKDALGWLAFDGAGGGARPNKYHVFISGGMLALLDNLDVLAKATSFPGKTIGEVPVYAPGGRKVVLQGDTEFEQTWEVTFYETNTHTVRTIIISWMNMLDNYANATHTETDGSSAIVSQLNASGLPTANYIFHNVWPKSIDSIELADDAANQIIETKVTFAFDYWEKAISL